MRIRSMRVVLVLLCMALVLDTGTWQACTSLSGLQFPSDIFNFSSAQHSEPKDINSNFLTTMLGAIPGSDAYATAVPLGIQPMSLRPPATSSSQNGWMSNALSLGASTNMSVNPALVSYSQLINRFPNQTNIFAPYRFG